jgi:hypothetical protein
MTITIQMTQTRQGDAGAVLTAGQTYSVRDDLAAQFVGLGYALDVYGVLSPGGVIPGYLGEVADEAAMLALIGAPTGSVCKRTDTGTDWRLDTQPAGVVENWRDTGVAGDAAAASAGLATSSGSDITAASLVGDLIEGWTSAGLSFEVVRTESIPTGIDILDSVGDPIPSLRTTLTRVGSSNYFAVTAGPIFISGRLHLTAAQFIDLKTDTDPADLVRGLAVAITDIGWLIDASGTQTITGGYKSYAGDGNWVWDRPLNIINSQSVVHTGTVNETLLRTLPTLPMNLLGKWDQCVVGVWRTGLDNGGTKIGKAFVNGSGSTNRIMQLTMNAGAGDATVRAMPMSKTIFHRGTTTEFEIFSFTNNGELTTNGVDGGSAQIAVNSVTADLSFTYSETLGLAGDSVTLLQYGVQISTGGLYFA